MIVERAELHHLSMPLKRPFETSFGVESQRECLLIHLFAEGLEGWGECPAGAWPGYSYETAATAWLILIDHFLPELLGKDIDDTAAFHSALAPFRGHPMARAGLEMALWDLWGKGQGRSLQALLGGSGATVEVGISIGIQPDEAATLSAVEQALEAGYRRVKLKVKPSWDLEPVANVRAAWADLPLWVDANAAYKRQDMDQLMAIDRLGLGLIEQPLPADDLVGHQQLQAKLATPICLDESIGGLAQARQAHELEACRIINVKPARVGGLSQALAIHEFARANSMPLWVGGLLETGVGRAANLALASLPGFVLPGDISASDRYYELDIASPRFELDQGMLKVPSGEGLGVKVDEEAMVNFELRRLTVSAS